jgi:photosystem II stability/assembly factor-like uncharacterized protein
MNNNNKFFFLSLFFVYQLAYSQSNIENITERFQYWAKMQEIAKHDNGHKIQQQEKEDGPNEHFERWLNFAKIRSKPNGEVYPHDGLWQEYANFQHNRRVYSPEVENIWQPLGPTQTPNDAAGIGRVNVLRFSPQNPNIIWAGAACGGLWKSENNGQSWEVMGTDNLPSISIADIAINSQNPDILYIATGDGAGYEVNVGNYEDFWGGTYSAGVFKSTDGGKTWLNIGLTFSQIQAEVIHRLLISPQNPDILLAATRNGIFRTRDAGKNWSKVNSVSISDMEWHPTLSTTIYAAGSRSLLISNDLGASWQTTTQDSFPSGKLSLSVSADAPNQVYVMSDFGNVYKSLNNGEDFLLMGVAPCIFYAYYSSVLEVSPINAQHLIAGGVEVAQSFNGGKNWGFCSDYEHFSANNYVHADQHCFGFQPISNHLWAANDGGISSTNDNGAHWQTHNNGLNIAQFYRISAAENEAQLLYGGLQDNGVMQEKNNQWTGVMNEGDGMNCLINEANENEVYAAYQFGKMYKSENGGKKFFELETPGGAWTTPFIAHPTHPKTLFYGGKRQVFISKDEGESWEIYSPELFQNEISALAIPQKYPHFLYVMNNESIYRTTDNGKTWETAYQNLPVSLANLSDISVSDYEPNKIWASFSGFIAGEKVYYSEDGGKTWENISGNLPNIPINCIEYQQFSNDVLYIGTDFGVFMKNGKRAKWQYWSNNLPNVIVNELEILYEGQKIRAATFGRGLWEAKLPQAAFSENNAAISLISPLKEVCSPTISPIVKLTNHGLDTLRKIDFLYYIDSVHLQNTYTWEGKLAYEKSVEIVLPALYVTSDTHNIQVEGINPNGKYDPYFPDNQTEGTFIFHRNALKIPFKLSFEDSLDLENITLDNSQIWQQVNVTQSENSHAALVANLYNASEIHFGNTSLDLNALDFSQVQAPISLSFDLAHVIRYDNALDTLKVLVSTDCGASWQTIYEKEGHDLVTDIPDFQYFKPNPSQWRTEILNLSNFAGQEMVAIRFDIAAQNSNNLWLDNLNIENFDTYNNVFQQEILFYPTATQSEVYVEIKGDFSEKAEVSIWNTTGQLVNFQKIEMNFQRKHKLNLGDLSAGVYLFEVRTDKQQLRDKLLIMK